MAWELLAYMAPRYIDARREGVLFEDDHTSPDFLDFGSGKTTEEQKHINKISGDYLRISQ